MSRKRPPEVSWHWLVGRILVDEAEHYAWPDEALLRSRFFSILNQFPIRQFIILDGFPYTEAAVAAASDAQLALIAKVLRLAAWYQQADTP